MDCRRCGSPVKIHILTGDLKPLRATLHRDSSVALAMRPLPSPHLEAEI
jgi:hypothetical protein